MLNKNLKILIISLFVCSCLSKQTELKQIEPTKPAEKTIALELVIKDYCLSDSTRQNFFLINTNVQLNSHGLLYDSDSDGIVDILENEYSGKFEISPDHYDYNGDLYPDNIIYLGGYTTDEQKKFKPCTLSSDRDGDGLSDCVEYLIGTNDSSFDSDKDGIPDGIEIRKGLSPLLKDSLLDTDKDGISNLEEVRLGTPLREDNSHDQIKRYTIAYSLENDTSDGKSNCYNYKISNIPLHLNLKENTLELSFIENKSNVDILKRFEINIESEHYGKTLEMTYSELVELSKKGIQP